MDQRRSDYPKYRLHRPSGQAVVTLGKDHYLGPHSSAASKAAYDRLMLEWVAQGRPSTFGQTAEVTVTSICAAYWRYATGYYCSADKPSGELHPIKSVLKLLRRLYGRTFAKNFDSLSLRAVRAEMINQKWSRKTINKQIQRVRRVFKWAASRKLVGSAIVTELAAVESLEPDRSLAPEREPVQSVPNGVVAATLPALPPVVSDMVRLQLLTAARPGEICLLRPCDVDTRYPVWQYCPAQHKNKHRGIKRVILVGPKAQKILTPYLRRSSHAWCFSPQESETLRRAEQNKARKTPRNLGNQPGTNRQLTPKRQAGQRYSTASYCRAIRRACQSAEVPPWSPNRLRHTAASEIAHSHGAEAARVVLGHASLSTTGIYLDRDIRLGNSVMQRIG